MPSVAFLGLREIVGRLRTDRGEAREAGLLKMMVVGKCQLNAAAAHHDEASAVHQPPILVVVLVVEFNRCVEQFFIDEFHDGAWAGEHPPNSIAHIFARARPGESVARFCNNPVRDDCNVSLPAKIAPQAASLHVQCITSV